ncbi:mannose-1-phosphate guanylyltransferase/mannose-6-phosphate isomerase [Paraburkholderia caballeronis]|uniref:mannose-1-phosphate guanylyltransferase/mannose-6-phosphate isomerase n=1 Tax=Paraburkholderia caballeronis TaxID=416943 RepID=UPI00106719B4|nr:mannose-1-phosphate guanylyltransferase/mannose-6-phosphate isomerase [Paraburkholderia caballeronis]TDV11135.1 mannose-1-phosphate guanylyltransferase (GDP) /mannose-6-phosphate isomerase type 2 [Paraburkholderia caballeronis]TDV14175.1 mannose-1-phosphate guanylyltransferase (GDP) /mannose-6-phosphate isomerase type 2 [Paraburkholderia caballeronis]TDV23340.1 mannose-1-phosphate guanylyltransferase (GDP) /mannose-6-phosphate isomerase type 2 [Paraburkholderia caballeronis]
MQIHPVILCGGSGTRLWPMSRSGYPKQYLKLAGERTLVQQAVLRAARVAGAVSPLVVTSGEQRFIAAEQMRQIGVDPSAIILEPVGRNTAPAIAVAALLASRENPDALLLVLPSDQVVLNERAFAEVAERAAGVAEGGALVTFGVEAVEPNIGYGYIRAGEAIAGHAGAYVVDAFVEKPDRDTARCFVEDGGYYWNSGMFMLNAIAYLDELRYFEPSIVDRAERALRGAAQDHDFMWLDASEFAACANVSIDYAVMERTKRAVVVEAPGLGWRDVGSWSTLAAMVDVDGQRNTLLGDVVAEDVSNAYIRAEHRMVAALGVDDVVIVETVDAVLVAHRDKVQDVRKIVERLNASGRQEARAHRRVVRPWGSYETIDSGERFQVKRIVVEPGAQLSLQVHHHRAEHWVVVKGTARVTNGDQETILTENQSTYVPLGVVHRLANPGKIPLELIEVQSGAYLGEDDIVRFDDTYGRSGARLGS